ncbi:MAG TPA: F0F1 ATP synthase subunit epsilon [Clostridiales bacterium]|nr:MAG: F0F1 ATP synthase subunit epsilon [Clostridiales bacterium GWD2_32_19]HCC08319.1 F0F1 ATP synthase subunit epsilon [Clostridiales bacterium]
MSDKKLRLQISTPDRDFYDDDVDMVVVKSVTGEMGILPHHLALATILDIGSLKIKSGNVDKLAILNGGFMEIKNNTVSILTDSAEWPEEIDIERAKQAKERAEERLRARDADIDFDRAEFALKKAINRIKNLENR